MTGGKSWGGGVRAEGVGGNPGWRRAGAGQGRKGPHLARLHLGQALLPRLLVLQADPHHAVYVEGVSVGRKKTCQLLFQEEEGTLERVYPLQGRQLLPSAKIIKVRSMVSIPSRGWDPLPPKSATPQEKGLERGVAFICSESILTLILDSISRLMKCFQRVAPNHKTIPRVQINESLPITSVVNSLRSARFGGTLRRCLIFLSSPSTVSHFLINSLCDSWCLRQAVEV